ncbi:MAG: type II toxin-antitoxin system HipA family toxin [Bacteriovoracaceae bacterium]|nr:type II toxin-antitoxin system HipA family toxin [Bacteriovoracaceae bacterium]
MVNYSLINKANVYLREHFAGVLEKTSSGDFLFKYDETWIEKKLGAIALSLPVKSDGYRSKNLHPFFDNLIPEGWLLSHAEKVYKIDKSNRFALLLATGLEPIGAVRVVALDSNGQEVVVPFEDIEKGINDKDYSINFKSVNGCCPYCLKELTLKQREKASVHAKCVNQMWGTTRKLLVRLSEENPLDSFRQTIYGASVSGAQKKGLFSLDGGKLHAGHRGAEYILKPQGDYDQLPENEHVTMAIAKEIGFDVPPFVLCYIENLGAVFAIKRFDIVNKDRLRLEDAAQILQIPSVNKYDSSNEKVATVISKYALATKVDLYDFWRRLIFSYLVANADMHLKNWSLVELGFKRGYFKLSPCYDLLNTRIPIPREMIDIGLTINGKSRNLQKSYFVKFGQKIGVTESYLEETFSNLQKWCDIADRFINKSFLDQKKKEKYLEIINERFKILRGN